MPLTIKELHDILGELYDAKNKENNIINNFENWFPFIHNKNTAYISPNKKLGAVLEDRQMLKKEMNILGKIKKILD